MFSIKTGYIHIHLSDISVVTESVLVIPTGLFWHSFAQRVSFINELGHGGSRDRKRGWITIFLHTATSLLIAWTAMPKGKFKTARSRLATRRLCSLWPSFARLFFFTFVMNNTPKSTLCPVSLSTLWPDLTTIINILKRARCIVDLICVFNLTDDTNLLFIWRTETCVACPCGNVTVIC